MNVSVCILTPSHPASDENTSDGHHDSGRCKMAALQKNLIKSYSVNKNMDLIYSMHVMDISWKTSRVDFLICTIIMRSYCLKTISYILFPSRKRPSEIPLYSTTKIKNIP